MLTINYQTGITEEAETLQEAMEKADNGAAYTQQNIIIEDENGNWVAKRSWWGCLTGIEECENPIQFGDFGFYGDWEIF
jgi:hypothetical protein